MRSDVHVVPGQSPTVDYRAFNPRAYVEEYYSAIGSENGFLLNFHEVVSHTLSPGARMLEFGGGPTIYQILSAATQVNEIVFSEYLAVNRAEIQKWLGGEPGAINWDRYLNYVLRLKGLDQDEQSRAWLRRTVAKKISAVIECDAFRPNVLGDTRDATFDVVASSFCIECLTGVEHEFLGTVHRLHRLLRRGGTLVLALLKGATSYCVGPDLFPAFPLDERYMSAVLKELRYDVMYLGSVPAEQEQGYGGIITIAATKK